MAVNGYRASDVFCKSALTKTGKAVPRKRHLPSAGGNELLSPLTETLYEIMQKA